MFRALIGCVAVLLALPSTMAQAPVITVTNVSPFNIAVLGNCVTVTGTGFSGTMYCSVNDGTGRNTQMVVSSSTSALCCLPKSTTTSAVTRQLIIWNSGYTPIQTGAVVNNAVRFSILPSVISVQSRANGGDVLWSCPQYGLENDYSNRVTIYGSDFGGTASNFDYIALGPSPADAVATIKSVSSNTIIAEFGGLNRITTMKSLYLGFLGSGYLQTTCPEGCLRYCNTDDSCLNVPPDCLNSRPAL